jgi:hypothetical protein
MACKICGRSSCTESFHNIEEQELYDIIVDDFRDEFRELRYKVKSLEKQLKSAENV